MSRWKSKRIGHDRIQIGLENFSEIVLELLSPMGPQLKRQ
jgi:hypothetical protein